MTNPVFKNIYATYGICTLISSIYALFLGWLSNFSFWQMFADAWIFGMIMKIELILMWYVLKYTMVKDASSMYKVMYRILFGVVVVLSVMGIETGLMYFIAKGDFVPFLRTIPTRMFVMSLVYLLIVRYYEILLSMEREVPKEEEEDDYEEEPVGVEEKKEEVATPVETLDIITVRNGQKIKLIQLSELICIRADGDYVELVTQDGHWLKELTMKYLEEHLPCQDFVRVHRSYIVRLSCISRVERYGQQQMVELKNGDKIRISATGYKQLRLKLNL